MNKIVFFAFKGEPMCFTHILLNSLDLHAKGVEVKIVIEGEATMLVKDMQESKNPLFAKVQDLDLIACICKACSVKLGVIEYNEKSGIPLEGGMNGHPAMSDYVSQGYQVITL